jgi:hypothetical protein
LISDSVIPGLVLAHHPGMTASLKIFLHRLEQNPSTAINNPWPSPTLIFAMTGLSKQSPNKADGNHFNIPSPTVVAYR